ncbi:MAG: DUF58 domain-containing protein [Gammaproteobacteria bacterium]|nr:DUF58 domain-containing protein [Gammaproteobacteria bacterium]
MRLAYRPAPRALRVLAGLFALGLAAAIWAPLAALFLPALALVLAVLLMDRQRLASLAPPRVLRRLNRSLPLGVWQEVELELHHGGGEALDLEVFDHVPETFELEGLPQAGRVPAGGFLRLHYRLKAGRRGDAWFPGLGLRLASPWGLWTRQVFVDAPEDLRVFPNFAAVTRYALLALEQREGSLGVMRRQRRGEGLEFHQLREYREGDALRQIDWKATSRHKKLIAREYQEERDQQIVFLLDAGRRMRAEDGETAHFDQALNAMLLLAYIALRQGDAVGLMSFAGADRYRAPAKGLSTVNALLNLTYDLQPSLDAADFRAAAQSLDGRLRKRALVVLLTTLRDDDGGELSPAVRYLRQRHLVLVADLRESVLDRLGQEAIADFQGALTQAAAEDFAAARRGLHERLGQDGVHMLDVTPAELPVRLVNRYLDIKASGLL